jgi:hypothetical protein
LYLTFRCNSRCGYCNVWQDPVFDGHQELTADGLRRCLDELAELGVTYPGTPPPALSTRSALSGPARGDDTTTERP